MTPRARKTWLLLAFALLILAGVLTLQGCTSDYQWKRTQDASASHQWIVVPYAELHRTCLTSVARSPNLGGCAFATPRGLCRVYSYLSEDEAARTWSGDGEDLRTHELKHCAGFVHERGM